MKISATVITLNEEKNIERCIQSLLPVADEIIVLDSFSTDKTPEICRQLSVTFVQHTFDGHIEQKNRAIEYTSYDYILSLDADEFLSEQLQESIRQIKNLPAADAFWINRLNHYCGKPMKHVWYPDKKIRLWHKSKGRWGGINPHDKVIMNETASKSHLHGDLMHFTFDTIEEHLLQINRFSSIKALESFKRNEKFSWLKLIFKPFFKFMKDFFLKKGILDGFYGLVISINSAHSAFLKYAKLKRLYHEIR